jgi:molecular chaperone GrpE
MTDEAKQGHGAAGGDGRRHRVRVNVARGEGDDPAASAAPAGRRAGGEKGEVAGSPAGDAASGPADDGTPHPAGDVASGPADARAEDDAAPAGRAAAPADVSEAAEALVAQACIEELAKAEAQRDAYLDQLQRLKAEFDNYRKRLQREGEALRLRAAEGLVESLLPVMDNMERALEAAGKHEENKLVDGVGLVSEQLRSVLASQGLEEVPAAPGVPFDPAVHEAVMAQESEAYPEGTITAVLEKGYLLHGRLLRPVKVIVAR